MICRIQKQPGPCDLVGVSQKQDESEHCNEANFGLLDLHRAIHLEKLVYLIKKRILKYYEIGT
jgi:hypothetical protein